MLVRNRWIMLQAPEDDKSAGGAGPDQGSAGDAGKADASAGDQGAGDAGKGAAGKIQDGADAGGDQGGSGDAGKGAGDAGAAGKDDGKGAKANGEGYWPNDWRKNIAGEDEKLLKRLERYGSPKALSDALVSVQNRISAGELRGTLPKNATEEQVKQWREENGVPESPEKYELALPKGLVIGEDDKPIIDDMLKSLHGVNATSAQVSQAVSFYYSAIEKAESDRQAADATAARAAEDALRNEWGPEFRANMNAIDGLLATAPGDVKEQIKFGRLADGTPILANADAIRWLNSMSREINPVTTLVPNAGADISGSIEAEIKSIEKDMGAPKGSAEHKAYWGDDKRQARYRALLEAKERTQKKA